jgi:photosystem II stability/assembly factor-like uncharacterized protein
MPAVRTKNLLISALLATSLVMLALLCAGSARAATPGLIPAGNTGWTWSNPKPQGNTLDRLEVYGGRAWAGGAAGTLLRSDDAGASWIAVRTGLLDDIRTIEPISQNSVIFAGRCALRRSDDGGATVRRLAWGSNDDSCAAQIQAVSFPSPLIGYLLLSNGDVYTSGDGGESWAKKSKIPGSTTLGGSDAVRDISFPSANTGVVSVGTHVYQSVDAGGSWNLVKTIASGAGFLNFDFLSSSVGFAAGDHTDVLKTTDGGLTWDPIVSDGSVRGFDVRSIDCVNETTCLAAAASGTSVLRTVDGGTTWTTPVAAPDTVYGVGLVSADVALAVGANGVTSGSGDGGATWSARNSVATGKYRGLRADSAQNTVIFGEAGALSRSTDAGLSWRTFQLPISGTIIDATFSGLKRGYAVDDAGNVLRTSDEGANWKIVQGASAKKIRAVYAWKPGRVAMIGEKGVQVSINAGAKAKAVKGKVAKLKLKSADPAGKTLFVYGPHAIATSKNSGKTWKIVRRPAKSAAVVRLDMLDAKYGYLLDANAELYSTKTGGKTWTRIETTGANIAVSMAFGDRKHGYLTDNTGRVLATSDAGATWSRQYPFYDANATSFALLAAPSKLSALTLVEGTNRVFGTTTGGRIESASLLTISASAPKARMNSVIRVTGKLTPATGSERVAVLARVKNAKGGTRWVSQERTVSATGAFTTSWKITASTEFIARWSGDSAHDGDAAPLQVVKLRK